VQVMGNHEALVAHNGLQVVILVFGHFRNEQFGFQGVDQIGKRGVSAWQ